MHAREIKNQDEIMLLTKSGQTVRCPVRDIRVIGNDAGGDAVNGQRKLLLLFGAIDSGIGGGIYNDVRPYITNVLADCVGGREIKFFATKRNNGAQRRQRALQFPTNLPVFSGQQDA